MPDSVRSEQRAGSPSRAPAGDASRSPRVCVISPGVAHAVPRTLALARYLDEIDFIDVPGTAERGVLEERGIRCHVPARAGAWPPAGVTLQRLIRSIAPDVICCHYGLGDHFFNAIAYGRCPVGVIAMGTDIVPQAGDARVPWLARLLSRMGLRRAGCISAKSRFLADRLRRMGVRSNVDINYWGCDLSRFRPADGAQARARLNLPAGARIVLSPRALEPRLNIHLIVEAFPAVLRHWPDSILVILGRSDPRYAKQVTDTVTRLGIGRHVRVVGEVAQEILPDYYAASDLVVSVASSEGFPNTLLEVMACGIPVLAGDIPQIHELLEDGVNARICGLDAMAIEAAMVEMLADPAAAARLAAAGRAMATEAGDIDRNAERWARQLRALAAHGETPGALSRAAYRATLLIHQLTRLVGFAGR